MTDDKAKARERTSQRLLQAADEPDLPDWLSAALRAAAAHPELLEDAEAAPSSNPFNFIYFH